MPQKSGDPNSSHSFTDMNVSAHLPEDHKSNMIFYGGSSSVLRAETIWFWMNKYKDKKELIKNLELNT